jgi:hypothetical protein
VTARDGPSGVCVTTHAPPATSVAPAVTATAGRLSAAMSLAGWPADGRRRRRRRRGRPLAAEGERQRAADRDRNERDADEQPFGP